MSNTTKDQKNQHLESASQDPFWWETLKDHYEHLIDKITGESSDDEDVKASDKDKADESDKKDADKKDDEEKKELSVKEIEEMEATAIAGVESGGAEYFIIDYGRFSDVTDEAQGIFIKIGVVGRPDFKIFPIEQIPFNQLPPFAVDDGPYQVTESGLPLFGDPPREGSQTYPPNNILVEGNLLENDFLGIPPGSITSASYDGGPQVGPDGNGVITIMTAIGEMMLYTSPFMGYEAGDFSYTLQSNALHVWGEGRNIDSGELFEEFTYTLTNSVGSSTANYTVQVIDDVPSAEQDYYEIYLPPIPAYDIVFVLDTSLSMLAPGLFGGGDSRLEIMQDALTSEGGILEGFYDASSALNFSIINFALAPSFYSTSDLADAISHIEGLGSGVSPSSLLPVTNYQAAVLAANASLAANLLNPALNGFEKKVYFMSDGAPFSLVDLYIPAGPINLLAWQTILALGNVDAEIINVAWPFPLSLAHMAPLGKIGDFPPVDLLFGDLSNIASFFPPVIPDLAQITGNVLDNDTLGADGLLDHLGPNGELGLYEINFKFPDPQDAIDYVLDNPGLGATANAGIVTIPIPNGDIPTPLGQTLHIDTSGNFTYTINSSAKDGEDDLFVYWFLDNDGDPAQSFVNLKIYAEPNPRDDQNIVFEAGLPDGNTPGFLPTFVTGNLLVNDTLGTDPTKILEVTHMGTSYTPVAGVINIVTAEWKIKILADGDYTFELTSPMTVPGSGPNVFDEIFTYTVSNITGVENSADLHIHIVDDVPVAVPDAPVSVVEGDSGAAGNVMLNDLLGADRPVYLSSFTYADGLFSVDTVNLSTTMYEVAVVTTYTGASLVVDNTGNWKYKPADWVANPFGAPIADGFTYTITDNDGDTSDGEQEILVEDSVLQAVDDGTAGEYAVHESALADGTAPGVMPITTTGNVLANDNLGADPGGLLGLPNIITQITYDGNVYTPGLISGIIEINTPEFSFSMDARDTFGLTAGDFSLTLDDNMAHPVIQGHNTLPLVFNYEYIDFDGTTTNADLTINVVDDVVDANSDFYQATIPVGADSSYSLIFMLDSSASMSFFSTKFSQTKSTVMAMIADYAALSSDLTIQIINFDSGSTLSTQFTSSVDAISYVSGLSTGGIFTNYNAGIDHAITAMGNADKDVDAIYMISDGRTFSGFFGSQPSNGRINNWDNALASNDYVAHITTLPGTSTSRLPLLDHDVFISSGSISNRLSDTADEIIPPAGGGGPAAAVVTGNILDNDSGADNPLVVESILISDPGGGGTVFIDLGIAGGSITLGSPGPSGDGFTLYENGDFIASSTVPLNASFTYVARDTDGDLSISTATLEILGGPLPPAPLPIAPSSFEPLNDYAYMMENSSIQLNVMDNDQVDPGSELLGIVFHGVGGPEAKLLTPLDGDVTVTTDLGGMLTFNSMGDVTYTIGDIAQNSVDHIEYVIQDPITLETKQLDLDFSIIADPSILTEIEGDAGNGHILSTENHSGAVLHMTATQAPTEFKIDMDDVSPPESVVIDNLGTAQEHVLTFTDVMDVNADSQIDLEDVVSSFTQDAPDASVNVTLHNQTTLVLHNIGTVAGNDVQSLELHLQQVTQAVNVQP